VWHTLKCGCAGESATLEIYVADQVFFMVGHMSLESASIAAKVQLTMSLDQNIYQRGGGVSMGHPVVGQ
jgi:hypothetical protein